MRPCYFSDDNQNRRVRLIDCRRRRRRFAVTEINRGSRAHQPGSAAPGRRRIAGSPRRRRQSWRQIASVWTCITGGKIRSRIPFRAAAAFSLYKEQRATDQTKFRTKNKHSTLQNSKPDALLAMNDFSTLLEQRATCITSPGWRPSLKMFGRFTATTVSYANTDRAAFRSRCSAQVQCMAITPATSRWS